MKMSRVKHKEIQGSGQSHTGHQGWRWDWSPDCLTLSHDRVTRGDQSDAGLSSDREWVVGHLSVFALLKFAPSPASFAPVVQGQRGLDIAFSRPFPSDILEGERLPRPRAQAHLEAVPLC